MGGVFSALSARSAEPQAKYELAGKMKDLSLGDAHTFPIDDLMSRQTGQDLVIRQLAGYMYNYIISLTMNSYTYQ